MNFSLNSGISKGFQTLFPARIFDIINICPQSLYICSNAAHIPCIFSVNTWVMSCTLWILSERAFYNFHKVQVCAAQFISQLDTPSSLPVHSLEFILKAIAQLVFNLGKVFSLVARFNSRYCCRLIQLPVSTHEGFAASQFLLFCTRLGRSATPQPQSKKHVFHLFIKTGKTPFSHTHTIISCSCFITTSIAHYTPNLKY